MSQAPSNGSSILDPFGVWKAARDANLEAWSKMMIDLVNSDEYAQATGVALEQILTTSQPVRDAMERSMTQTLGLLNMPSRAEVVSLAERLVNIEMRLDDMDAKLSTVQKSLQETTKKTIHEAVSKQNDHVSELVSQIGASQNEAIKNIEAHLVQISAKISALHLPDQQPAEPMPAPKPAHRPNTRPAITPTHEPNNKRSTPVKNQEAK